MTATKFPPAMEVEILAHMQAHRDQLNMVIHLDLAPAAICKAKYLEILRGERRTMIMKLNGSPDGADHFGNAGVDGEEFIAIGRLIAEFEGAAKVLSAITSILRS